MTRDQHQAALARLLEIVARGVPEGEPPKRSARPCARCSKNPNIPAADVPEAESWVHDGSTHYAATCSSCTDLEFSERWQRRFAKATSEETKGALEKQLDEWTRSGRRYVGTSRPGAPAPRPARPHVSGCRCQECRERAVAAAQADASLFPPGFGP
jgi:hypothetical protein